MEPQAFRRAHRGERGDVSGEQRRIRREHRFADVLRRKQLDHGVRPVQNPAPLPRQVGRARGRPVEGERRQLVSRIAGRAPRLGEDAARREAGILPACRPRQIAERLQARIARRRPSASRRQTSRWSGMRATCEPRRHGETPRGRRALRSSAAPARTRPHWPGSSPRGETRDTGRGSRRRDREPGLPPALDPYRYRIRLRRVGRTTSFTPAKPRPPPASDSPRGRPGRGT